MAGLRSKIAKVTFAMLGSNPISLESKHTIDKLLNQKSTLLSNCGQMNYMITPMFHDRR